MCLNCENRDFYEGWEPTLDYPETEEEEERLTTPALLRRARHWGRIPFR